MAKDKPAGKMARKRKKGLVVYEGIPLQIV